MNTFYHANILFTKNHSIFFVVPILRELNWTYSAVTHCDFRSLWLITSYCRKIFSNPSLYLFCRRFSYRCERVKTNSSPVCCGSYCFVLVSHLSTNNKPSVSRLRIITDVSLNIGKKILHHFGLCGVIRVMSGRLLYYIGMPLFLFLLPKSSWF